MNAYIGKAILIALLLAGFPLMYLTLPSGDRWFAVIPWLVFTGVVGSIILLMPVLHCPCCGRATSYFDNYSERTDRLTGGYRRRIRCSYCHSIIDRLSGVVIAQLPKAQGRLISRFSFLLKTGSLLCCAGYCSALVSFLVGFLVVPGGAIGGGNPQRASVILLGCGVALVAGLLLAVAGHLLRRRAHRLAAESGIAFR